jgi:hypothetical protein
VLDRVKPRALAEHPAGEDALDLAVELDLIYLDEGRGVRRLGGRARVAHPRRYLQGAELHRLIDRYLQMRDAAGHLVERGEHGDRVLDLLGQGQTGEASARHGEHREDQGQACARFSVRSGLGSLHHAAHLTNEL